MSCWCGEFHSLWWNRIEWRICNDKEYVYCMWDGQISRWFEWTYFFQGVLTGGNDKPTPAGFTWYRILGGKGSSLKGVKKHNFRFGFNISVYDLVTVNMMSIWYFGMTFLTLSCNGKIRWCKTHFCKEPSSLNRPRVKLRGFFVKIQEIHLNSTLWSRPTIN